MIDKERVQELAQHITWKMMADGELDFCDLSENMQDIIYKRALEQYKTEGI